MDFNNCESILQFHIKSIPSYICPFAPSYVKSLQEQYIGGYLFYIYLGWLPNGTVTIARSFLHYTISTYKSYFGYGDADSRDDVIYLLDS